MRFIGIDPGKTGGVAVLDKTGSVLFTDIMRDLHWFAGFLEKEATIDYMILLELAQAFPGNSASAMWTYAFHNGQLCAALELLKRPYELVQPRVWNKVMHVGCKDLAPKDKSRQIVQRLFPGEDLTNPDNPRSKKIHEGIMDALLIAEYGRRKCLGL